MPSGVPLAGRDQQRRKSVQQPHQPPHYGKKALPLSPNRNTDSAEKNIASRALSPSPVTAERCAKRHATLTPPSPQRRVNKSEHALYKHNQYQPARCFYRQIPPSTQQVPHLLQSTPPLPSETTEPLSTGSTDRSMNYASAFTENKTYAILQSATEAKPGRSGRVGEVQRSGQLPGQFSGQLPDQFSTTI